MGFTARPEPVTGTRIKLTCTCLEAGSQSHKPPLPRRPRHTDNADAWHGFGGGASAGVGVQRVLDREDIDAASFARADQENYLITRL